MAREEQDREDLMREATALVERVEIRVAYETENVIVGFRRDGSPSFFFGADPVYQFNSRGELRRAFVNGLMYKSQSRRLVSLDRKHLADQTRLISLQLDDKATQDFIDAAEQRLRCLANSITELHYELVAKVPTSADVVGRVRASLDGMLPIQIAKSPRVG